MLGEIVIARVERGTDGSVTLAHGRQRVVASREILGELDPTIQRTLRYAHRTVALNGAVLDIIHERALWRAYVASRS